MEKTCICLKCGGKRKTISQKMKEFAERFSLRSIFKEA